MSLLRSLNVGIQWRLTIAQENQKILIYNLFLVASSSKALVTTSDALVLSSEHCYYIYILVPEETQDTGLFSLSQ